MGSQSLPSSRLLEEVRVASISHVVFIIMLKQKVYFRAREERLVES